MDRSNAISKSQLKAQGALILSELNDIKRTVEACAKEINWDKSTVQNIVDGNSDLETINKFIDTCAAYYPINKGNFILLENDCERGVKVFSQGDSVKTSRIFNRANRYGKKTAYYEYRDTVMSKLGYFRPEWIKQLRYVEDNNPHNPDVVYNNGHFMHQVTFFVGPVNFYYEADGVKHCEEMNTGDSNYITPFYPHSFTTRDPSQEAYIIAVTFGANTKRALKELYHLGLERSKQYTLNLAQRHKATQNLLDYHLSNNRMTRAILEELLNENGFSINISDTSVELSDHDLNKIATFLSIDMLDLVPYNTQSDAKVIVKRNRDTGAYLYPSKDNATCSIKPLASISTMPLVRACQLEVLKVSKEFLGEFKTGLHTYVFNYGSSPCEFSWKYEGKVYLKTLLHGDSLYIQPFIEHQFRKVTPDGKPELCCVSIPGEMTLETQKEFSRLKDIQRTVFESKCWFN